MKPASTRSARSCSLTCSARLLLGLAAISAADMEHLSFGHHHLEGDHAVHHHHVSSGAPPAPLAASGAGPEKETLRWPS